ncbi:Toxin HigB-2 [compost metagenome]
MIFIETPIFTEDLAELLSDEEYRAFQAHLAENPEAGDLIQGTGGLRKVRWAANGKGKRGGVRVIYYHVTAAFQIRLLLIYRKGIQDNLTEAEKQVLRKINEGWK